MRWRHRLFFVALLVVGMIIAVGPSPYADPTPLGAVFKAFANSSSAGLALRSTGARRAARRARARGVARPRRQRAVAVAAPARAPGARRRGDRRRRACSSSSNLPALFNGTLLRQEPRAARERARRTGRRRRSTSTRRATRRACSRSRAPTSPSYTWGNTVDPITPGLMDRPYVARELIPYGTRRHRRPAERVRPPLPGGRRRSGGRRRAAAAHGHRRRRAAQRHPVPALRPRVAARAQPRVRSRFPGLGPPTAFGPPSPSSQVKPAPGRARGGRDRPRRARQRAAAQPGRRVPGRATRRRSCARSRRSTR